MSASKPERKQGLPRSSRMTERRQFIRLFDNPSVYRAQTFQAFWKPNERNTGRLGITIKGRLGSVWRTRIKRVVREWFRVNKELIGQNDVNVVIRVPAVLDKDFLDRLVQQLNRWKFK